MIEYNGVRILDTDLRNFSTMIISISNQGWRILGKGEHSVVFDHPERNFVIKITVNDPMAVKWLKACAENTNENPFLPKVYAVHDVKFSRPSFSPSYNNSTVGLGLMREDEMSLTVVGSHNHVRKATVSFVERLEPSCNKHPGWILMENLVNDHTVQCVFGDSPNVKHFEEVANMMYRIVRNKTHLIDLHAYNIMLRGSQPVIADPFSS